MSLREAHAVETRERLLSTTLTLIERGEEPTMRAVAREARVGERTAYRYFETRDSLYAALAPRLVGKTGVPLCARFDDLMDYASALYRTFDENRELNVALLTAPWAAPWFRASRRKNLDAMKALVDAAFGAAPATERMSAAAVLRAQLSGSGWMYLRVSCDLPNEAVLRHACWLIDTTAARLRAAHRRGQA